MSTVIPEAETEYDLPPPEPRPRRLLPFLVIAAILIAVGIFAAGRIRSALQPADQTQYKVAAAGR